MSAIVKGCGCRPDAGDGVGTAAGVRKPPGKEPAGRRTSGGELTRSMGIWSGRPIGRSGCDPSSGGDGSWPAGRVGAMSGAEMGAPSVDGRLFRRQLGGRGRAGLPPVGDGCFGRAWVLGLNAAILVMTCRSGCLRSNADGRWRGAVPAAKVSTTIMRPPQQGQRCVGVAAVSPASSLVSVHSVAAASAVAASSNWRARATISRRWPLARRP